MKKSFLIFSFFVGASTVFSAYGMDSSKVRKSLEVFNFEDKPYVSKKDINDKFKKMSLALHPDRGGSTEEMQSLSEARDVLLSYILRFEKWENIRKAARRELKKGSIQRLDVDEEFVAIAAEEAKRARTDALRSSF